MPRGKNACTEKLTRFWLQHARHALELRIEVISYLRDKGEQASQILHFWLGSTGVSDTLRLTNLRRENVRELFTASLRGMSFIMT